MSIITFFNEWLVVPITGGPDRSFVTTVRAVALVTAFLLPFPATINGIVILAIHDAAQRPGVWTSIAGCTVFFVSWFTPYILARARLWCSLEVLCDIVAVGFLAAFLLWDIGAPTFLPMGFSAMLLAALAGWSGTPRGIFIMIATVLVMIVQSANLHMWRRDLHDRADFFEEQALLLASKQNATAPTFSSNFPFQLYVSRYYFPTLLTDVLLFAAVIFATVVTFFAMRYQTSELCRQNNEAVSAVRAVARIAEDLRRYNTLGARTTLCRAQGKAPPGTAPRDDSPSGPASGSVSQREPLGTEGRSAVGDKQAVEPQGSLDDVRLSTELAATLEALVANLDAYRPYLPHWLLEGSSEGCDEGDDEGEDRSASMAYLEADGEPDAPGDSRAAVLSDRGRSTASHRSSADADGRGSNAGSATQGSRLSRSQEHDEHDLGHGCGHGVDSRSPSAPHTASPPADMMGSVTSPLPVLETGPTRSHHRRATPSSLHRSGVRHEACSFAVVTFEAREDGALARPDATLTGFTDAVHTAAAESKGAVHSFALGEAIVSWNCATTCANPETKAARFAARLRTAAVSSSCLDRLRCGVAITTGKARCETAGTAQRAVTTVAPAAAIRLRALIAVARAAAAESSASFAAVCDAATTSGAATNFYLGPVGVFGTRGASPALSIASLLHPQPTRVASTEEEDEPEPSPAAQAEVNATSRLTVQRLQ